MTWRVCYRRHWADPWEIGWDYALWAGAWWEVMDMRAHGWAAEVVR